MGGKLHFPLGFLLGVISFSVCVCIECARIIEENGGGGDVGVLNVCSKPFFHLSHDNVWWGEWWCFGSDAPNWDIFKWLPFLLS